MNPTCRRIRAWHKATFIGFLAFGISSHSTIAMAQSPGTFVAIGNMNAARTEHTATLLKSGKVLIAGGWDDRIGPLATAELYDPSTRTFTSTGRMISTRVNHVAILLNDGRVLIVGGNGYEVSSPDTELYDPSTGEFLPTSKMTTPRSVPSATLLSDGTVLIAGGSDPSDATFSDAEIYDPAAGTFTTTGSMVVSRSGHSATVLKDGRVLIAGGYEQNAADWPDLASAELYDPSTRTFAATGSMISARGGSMTTLLQDGTVLIIGRSGLAELYDPSTGTFASAGSITISPAGVPVRTQLRDGRVLFTGGVKEVCVVIQSGICTGFGIAFTPSADLYDPIARTFSSAGNMIASRSWHTATLLRDGTVLVAGGTADRRERVSLSLELKYMIRACAH